VKYLGTGVLGILGFLLSRSLFAYPLALPLQAFLVWSILYLIFFGKRKHGIALLAGTVVGMELWGDRLFGLACLLGVCIYHIAEFFSNYIRLTAPLNRFFMAWLLSLFLMFCYIFPLSDLKRMWIPGVILYMIGAAAAISLVSWRDNDLYNIL
jgi:hypothetical protein